MVERGVSVAQARQVLASKPFQYFHDGVWKTGYYDPASQIFIGTAGGNVTTVIRGATQKYINNLKALRP
jgi:hypothetical protein